MNYNAEEHEPEADVKGLDELARKNCRISPIESRVEEDAHLDALKAEGRTLPIDNNEFGEADIRM